MTQYICSYSLTHTSGVNIGGAAYPPWLRKNRGAISLPRAYGGTDISMFTSAVLAINNANIAVISVKHGSVVEHNILLYEIAIKIVIICIS